LTYSYIADAESAEKALSNNMQAVVLCVLRASAVSRALLYLGKDQ
jgi:hypothetical protein